MDEVDELNQLDVSRKDNELKKSTISDEDDEMALQYPNLFHALGGEMFDPNNPIV